MSDTNEVTTEVTTQETMTHVRNTKRVFKNVRKSNTTLFVTIREAYDALFDDEYPASHKQNLQWRRYRLEVEEFCDKSSLNKIVSICQNDLIMKNIDRLPIAWSTLSTLDVLLKTDDETVAKTFVKFLDSEEITVTSTAKSIVDLLTTKTGKKASTSLTIVFYSNQIALMSEEDRTIFEEASASLAAIGFKMKDMCKKTKEVKEEASNDASSDTTDSTDSVQEAA
jgi:hypothetical protein